MYYFSGIVSASPADYSTPSSGTSDITEPCSPLSASDLIGTHTSGSENDFNIRPPSSLDDFDEDSHHTRLPPVKEALIARCSEEFRRGSFPTPDHLCVRTLSPHRNMGCMVDFRNTDIQSKPPDPGICPTASLSNEISSCTCLGYHDHSLTTLYCPCFQQRRCSSEVSQPRCSESCARMHYCENDPHTQNHHPNPSCCLNSCVKDSKVQRNITEFFKVKPKDIPKLDPQGSSFSAKVCGCGESSKDSINGLADLNPSKPDLSGCLNCDSNNVSNDRMQVFPSINSSCRSQSNDDRLLKVQSWTLGDNSDSGYQPPREPSLRFPYRPVPKPPGKSSVVSKPPPPPEDLQCRWQGCMVLLPEGKLLDHLEVEHVEPQISGRDDEEYMCLWEPCKVMGKPSCSLSWLKRHILTHGGNKPHKCMIEGCGQRFTTQVNIQTTLLPLGGTS